MVADKAVEVTARLKKLYFTLASEGPTDNTGRVLRALADVCDPVRKFAALWDAVTNPYVRKRAAAGAVDAAVEYLK